MEGLKKISYSIGQVSEMSGLAQSTIRYWETVFEMLNPNKTEGGSRRYREKDIELLLKIKELLHEKGFTIKGAKAVLKNPENDFKKTRSGPDKQEILKSEAVEDFEKFKIEIISDLERIKNSLK